MRNFIRLLLISALLLISVSHLHAKKREEEYYRIDTLNTPDGVVLEAGNVCILGPDKLACASRFGDVWIAEEINGDKTKPKWTLYASGLHEVLGLAVKPGDKDGWLYCTQRCDITRMRDSNGDGRADVFEVVSDGWGIDGDYHEYAFGSKFDKDGNLFVALCLTGSGTSTNLWRGWCLKIDPDGKATPVISGIRSPGGIGFNAEGALFYTDNQGNWNGACKLQQIIPGTFVGHPAGLKWFDEPTAKDAIASAGIKKPEMPKSGGRLVDEMKRIPELAHPTVYFPYPRMGASAAGFANDSTKGKFGPFQNQLFVGDQTTSMVMRVFLEQVDGHYQGVCFPFRKGFMSGAMSVDFAQDGSLFVYGTDRGWTATGGKPFGLQRVTWNGETPFEIHEMRVKKDGFELTFTEPLDEATAKDTASFTLKTYTYIYHDSYGSPEVDQTTPKIVSSTIAADKKSVRLVIEGLQIGHVHELQAPGIKSANGEPLLHDLAYYTLFHIPKK